MSKRILKQLAIALTSASVMMNVYAVAPGFYMGLMLGPANNSASDQQAQVQGSPAVQQTVTATPHAQQFGSRVEMGYKVSQYGGVEFGATYFSGIRYDTKNVQTCSSANARVRDIDVVAMGTVPLRSFSMFGKAGVAVAYQTTAGTFNPDFKDVCGKSTYLTKFVPTVSVGASYDLSQNWVADLSWNDVMVGGKIGSMTLLGIGITYHFVDVYCGQFLC